MKVIAIVKYVFTLVGLAMLIGAFFMFRNTSTFVEQAVKTDGQVVDMLRFRTDDSVTYAPVVEFTTPDNESIQFTSSSSNPPSYARGDTVEVLYLPSTPEEARINGFFPLWGGAIAVGAFGTVFFLIGFGIILAIELTRRKGEYLKKHGTPVQTDFKGVELNGMLEVNGVHPFRISSQWLNPLTSELHIFKSNNLWFDPTDYITSPKITVFIDRNDPRKYHVDLSFLPKLAD